jgi:hypothetical protein
MAPFVWMTIRRILNPGVNRASKKRHAASGDMRAIRIELMKHIAHPKKRERGWVIVVSKIVESGVQVTVRKHDLNNPVASESLWSGCANNRDFRQQGGIDRGGYLARFSKNMFAVATSKIPGTLQGFEEGSPRLRSIAHRSAAAQPCARTSPLVRPAVAHEPEDHPA